MKKQLLAGLMIAGMSLVAQTPRLSLFEEFTGETCPPCAATNPGLNTILSSSTNTPLVVAIKWQVPIPSAPTTTWSLYKTNKAEIDWRYQGAAGYGYPSQWTSTTAVTSGINAAPTGLFDGQHQWVFGAVSDHPYYVDNAVIAAAQSYTSAFSVTMNRAWDPTFSSVNVTVNITASANFTATGALVFRLVMVEKEIHFATQPGTNGEKDFYDAAIASFPSLQAGTSMAAGWITGQSQTFTVNCPVPSYCRDKAQVAFVGFIQDDGNRKVAQAVRANTDPLANDAKAVSAVLPSLTCTNSVAPTITFKNNGTNAITAATITPYVDGTAGANYSWAGSLAIGASTTITLPNISVAGGSHTFSYNISNVSGTDFNMNNNFTDTKFITVTNYQGTPVAEGFTATAFPPTNWAAFNSTGAMTWVKTTACGGFALTTNSTKLNWYNGIASGAVDELLMPPMHFTATAAPSLSFDLAYCQYASGDDDKLEVLVSDDCGATWNSVYSKTGTSGLSTRALTTAAFTASLSSDWRREVVALTGFNLGDMLVKFVGTSDFGNNLYIDNVNLSQKANPTNTTAIANVAASEVNVKVYPNPANTQANIVINAAHSGKASVKVVNALGQLVYTNEITIDAGMNSMSLDVKEFADGIYNVVVDTESGSTVKKLTVTK